MPGNGTGSHGARVTRADVVDALQVLRIAARWALTPARWAEVGDAVTAAMGALAIDDRLALRASLDYLSILGPVRSAAASASQSAPEEVLADLTALLDALAELESIVDAQVSTASLILPVSIYMSDTDGHERVEAAVEELALSAGLVIAGREDPILGSWFRRMQAQLIRAARAQVGQEALADVARRAEIELVERSEAQVAALLMAGAAPLIGSSLRDAKDAVVRFGAVLIVKRDGSLYVNQLTARQQLILNHSPHLLSAPEKIFHALGLPQGDTAAAAGETE
jgi:hypothetical protein